MNFIEKQLQEGEELVMFVRHYPLSYLLKAVILFIYFLLPFFFLFPLWDAGVLGKAVFWILLVSAVLLAVRFWVKVYYNSLLITDRRIIEIHQRGLLEQHVAEVMYDRIQNISYARKGLLQMLFGYGSVIVHSSSYLKPIEIRNVHNPREVREMIARLMEEVRLHNPRVGVAAEKEDDDNENGEEDDDAGEEGTVRVVDIE